MQPLYFGLLKASHHNEMLLSRTRKHACYQKRPPSQKYILRTYSTTWQPLSVNIFASCLCACPQNSSPSVVCPVHCFLLVIATGSVITMVQGLSNSITEREKVAGVDEKVETRREATWDRLERLQLSGPWVEMCGGFAGCLSRSIKYRNTLIFLSEEINKSKHYQTWQQIFTKTLSNATFNACVFL